MTNFVFDADVIGIGGDALGRSKMFRNIQQGRPDIRQVYMRRNIRGVAAGTY